MKNRIRWEMAAGFGAQWQAVIFAIALCIVVSRRPDALFHPQFYAEDGAVFYSNAYSLGLRSIALSYRGYLHIEQRLVALFTLLVPFVWAPLVMNLFALTCQVLPVNIFLSSRFSNIALPFRLIASVIYLALPNSLEINANLTNVQSHLALLACLILLAPASSKLWRVFDATLLVLISLSSPMGFLLLPLALWMWWRRRDKGSARSLAFLGPGVIVQALTFALNWRSRQIASNGASVDRFLAIIGRQVFASALLGLNTQGQMMRLRNILWIESVATLLGLAVLLYALRYAAIELKVFILFAAGVLTLALVSPLAGPPSRPQWDWLSVPACGNRYYFMPMLAFLISLLWMATRNPSPKIPRLVALAMLFLLPIGIWQDWNYPRFVNYHFRRYAAEFERSPSGTEVTIPINPPDWTMKITKR